ncbi:50S ribosomal protein L30 [uncultured archaeon]|nr:50S ribosomal protein L30 [uncultured archaeon]
MSFICAIRIRGLVGVRQNLEENLDRLRLKRKYSCVVLINPDKAQLGMIYKSKNDVAYGEISKENFEKILEKRGQLIDKKKKLEDVKKISEGLEKGKKYSDFNLKPFFRLHSPRGGVKSTRLHYPKGILGSHGKDINKLLEKML